MNDKLAKHMRRVVDAFHGVDWREAVYKRAAKSPNPHRRGPLQECSTLVETCGRAIYHSLKRERRG